MGKFINLEGRTFGMLTVLKRAENRNNRVFWTCKCECGNIKDIRASSLLSEATRSCGCMTPYKYNQSVKNTTNRYDLSGEYGVGYTSKNEPFYFDLEDYEKIKKYSWYISDNGYVTANTFKTETGKQHKVMLHRLVMGITDKTFCVDHIYHKKFDNRKSQLRIVTPLQNSQNRTPKNENQGVYWHKNKNKWEALIGVGDKIKYLGCYDSYEEALLIRKKAEIEYFGEYRYKVDENDVDELDYDVINKITNSKVQQESITKNNFCVDCGKKISLNAKRCVDCYNKDISFDNNNRITREELKSLIRTKSFVEIGKMYNVSDNAIRKWCNKYGLPKKSKHIKQITDDDWEKI